MFLLTFHLCVLNPLLKLLKGQKRERSLYIQQIPTVMDSTSHRTGLFTVSNKVMTDDAYIR